MNCETPSRLRPTCAQAQLPPIDPDIGDRVRLKSEPGKTYVVTGVICERFTRIGDQRIQVATRLRVGCTEGFSRNVHEVGLCELEARDGPGADPVPDDTLPIVREEDVLDFLTSPSADPFATVEQATIALNPPTGGAIQWERADARGEVLSRDGRFMIVKRASLWQAIDFDRCQKSLTYGERADAVSWCELQVKIDAISPPQRDALGSPITPPASESLAWDHRKGVLWSIDERFSIHSLDPEGSTVHFAVDHESSDSFYRRSPNGTQEQAKAWCQARSHCRVVATGGQESLVPKEDLGEVTF